MGSNKNTAFLQGGTVAVLSSTATLVLAGTLSVSGTTSTIAIPYLDNIGIQINVTAPALTSGTFAVNVSNDNANFVALSLSGSPIVAGANDTINISLNQVPYRFMNITYASGTAGTGSYVCYLMAKGLS